MSVLSDAIESLSAALVFDDAPPIYSMLPERITPPAILLKPADPWISTQAHPMRIGEMTYELVVIPRPGINGAQETAAIDLVAQIVQAMTPATHPWVVETVSAPYDLAIGEAVYLAVRVTVSAQVRIATL